MRRRRPAVLLALPLLLAGCGTSAAGPDPAASASAGRAVTHARGTTLVPDRPQRVVVLEPVQLDTAVALGVRPVGAAVAALRPDLVLGTETRHSALHDELSAIAPTVFLPSQADPWQGSVRRVAEALGRPGRGEELLDTHAARCAEVAAEHDLAGTTANLLRPRDESTVSVYGPTSFAGSVLECAGFDVPDRDWEGSISVDVSPERVPDAAADHVFVTVADVTDPDALPAVVRGAGPAFGRVHAVDQATWVSGVGPLGGRAVLDDLDALLDAG